MNFTNYRQILLLSCGIFVSPFIALAAPFTQKEAMQAVSDKLTPNAEVVYTQQQEGRALYHVINRGNDQGFCIVGNTPDGETRLLGYTDSGNFDLNDAPDGLRLLLEAFTQRMSQESTTGATSHMNPALRTPRKDIAPMITAKWHQRSPYNDMIPGNCPTGCVATAFGQILKYYQNPTVYSAYSTPSVEYNGTTYTLDRTCKIDWANILDSYDSKSTDAQKKAVATLMKYLSISFDAYFTPSGTSTSVATAVENLKYLWGYDDGIYDWDKSLFEADVWEEMIYKELYNKRPVVMGGRSASGAHAFVIDGYDNKNKLYHINWGWASGDGYFDLDLTNTGDSFTAYSDRQEATVGIQPKANLTTSLLQVMDGSHKVRAYHKQSDNKVRIEYDVQNVAGAYRANCNLGIEVKDLNAGTYRTIKLGQMVNASQQASGRKLCWFYLSFDTIPVGSRWMINPIYWYDDPKQYSYIPAEERMRNIKFEVIGETEGPSEVTEYFDHLPVVESYFYGGCGYSYNADMILDSLQRQCGDQAIIINLHNNLDVVGSAKNYSGLPFNGSPNTMIDRQNCQRTGDQLFNLLKKVDAKAPAKVQIANVKRETGTHDIIVKTRSRFGFSATRSDYRIAYVLIEDSVPNGTQKNPVSGSAGTYFGNVQNLPDPYPITFHHCARAIYPCVDGDEGSFPSQIQKSTDYDNEYRFTIDPATISDISNLRLATLLLDACSGTVLNADVVKLSQFDLSDRNLEITVQEPGTLWEQLKDKWQYIKLLKVSGRINGDDMNVIRIMCGLEDVTNVLPKGEGLLTDLDLEDAQLVAGGLVYSRSDQKYYQQNDALAPYTFFTTENLYTINLRSLKLPKGLKHIGEKSLYALSNIKELYIPDYVEGMIGLPVNPIKLNISPNNRNYVRQGQALYTAAFDTLVMFEAPAPSKVIIDLRCNYVDNTYCNFYNADTLVFPCTSTVDSRVAIKGNILYYGKYNTYVGDDFGNFKGDYLLIESPYMTNGMTYVYQRSAAAPKESLSHYINDKPWFRMTWTAIEDLDVTWDERGVLIEADQRYAFLDKPHQMRYAISKTKLLGNGVQWTSSNQSVATIDADGNLKPLKKGQTTITVKVKNTNYSAKCLVTVTDEASVAITEVSEATAPTAIYSLDGKPLSAPSRGINIIREGGKTRKVIIL